MVLEMGRASLMAALCHGGVWEYSILCTAWIYPWALCSGLCLCAFVVTTWGRWGANEHPGVDPHWSPPIHFALAMSFAVLSGRAFAPNDVEVCHTAEVGPVGDVNVHWACSLPGYHLCAPVDLWVTV